MVFSFLRWELCVIETPVRVCVCIHLLFHARDLGTIVHYYCPAFFPVLLSNTKREQIVHHKHTSALTESLFQAKASLISLSVCNYMQTHTFNFNQNVFGKTLFNAKYRFRLELLP